MLRTQLAEARGQAAQSSAVRGARTRSCAGSTTCRPCRDIPGVTAQVIAGSPGNFESTIADRQGLGRRDHDRHAGRHRRRSRRPRGAGVAAGARRCCCSPTRTRASRCDSRRAAAPGRERPRRQRSAARSTSSTRDFKVKPGEIVSTAAEHGLPVGHPRRHRRRPCSKSPGAIEQTILVRPVADIGRAIVVARAQVAGAAVGRMIRGDPPRAAAHRDRLVQTTILPYFRDPRASSAISGWWRRSRSHTAKGPETGAIFGFAAGLCMDLFLQTPLGLAALVVRPDRVPDRDRSRARSCGAPGGSPRCSGSWAGIVGGLLFVGIGALVGQEQLFELRSLRIVVLAALYDAVVAPIMFPIVTFVLRDHAPRRTSEAGGPTW